MNGNALAFLSCAFVLLLWPILPGCESEKGSRAGSNSEAETDMDTDTDTDTDTDSDTDADTDTDTDSDSDSAADSDSETGVPRNSDTSRDTDDEPDTEENPEAGEPCGWQDKGEVFYVTPQIELCLPWTICNMETCQADLGTCEDGINGSCTFNEGYDGLGTLPEAWATWYCQLSGDGGCQGILEYATKEIKEAVHERLQIPYCYEDSSTRCLGITALSPVLGGNSRLATNELGNPLAEWGLGLTPASGLCYEIEGPTGNRAVIAATDRCAGYCDCGGGMEECGNCMVGDVPEPDEVKPGCPCVGEIPSLGPDGDNCAGEQTCDWCMSNSHPHFDLDIDTFNHICADEAIQGSCRMNSVKTVECMEPVTWPCPEGSGFCFGEFAVNRIPGTYCCTW